MNENKQPHAFVPQMASFRDNAKGQVGNARKQGKQAGREQVSSCAPEPPDGHIFGTGAWHAAALDIARGTGRYLRARRLAVVAEMPLADGRRADMVALDARGCIAIIEVKSCLADFRSDCKWEDYRQWCDRFYFAVDTAFPQDCIPDDCGLIVADRFDAEALREPPEHRLDAARRRAMTLRIARCAAFRLHGADDPDIW